MEARNCLEMLWYFAATFVKYQILSDFFMATAYFSIPIGFIYFNKNLAGFSHNRALMLLGVFAVVCGSSHLLNMWSNVVVSRTVAVVMTIGQVSAASVSFATVLMLFRVLAILERQRGMARRGRKMAQEIRNSQDKHTILRTAVSELGKAFGLVECTLWMPMNNGNELLLCRTYRHQITIGTTVPAQDPVVQQIFSRKGAIDIPNTCPMANIRPHLGRPLPTEVLGVRIPLRRFSFNQTDGFPGFSSDGYGVLVLMPPCGTSTWYDHDIDIINSTVDQVDIALSQVALIEESVRFHDQLREHGFYQDLERIDAEAAFSLHGDLVSTASKLMQIPMDAISALASLLQVNGLAPQQSSMVDAVLKSTHYLAKLAKDASDLSSAVHKSSIVYETKTFNLHELFEKAIDVINPIAAVKKLKISYEIEQNVPKFAAGDVKLLKLVLLKVLSNAIRFTKEGGISIKVQKAAPESVGTFQMQVLQLEMPDGFYLQVQVKDSGCGFKPVDFPPLLTRYREITDGTVRQGNKGLGLAISKRIMKQMGGDLCLQSEGCEKGATATITARLGPQNALELKAECNGYNLNASA